MRVILTLNFLAVGITNRFYLSFSPPGLKASDILLFPWNPHHILTFEASSGAVLQNKHSLNSDPRI